MALAALGLVYLTGIGVDSSYAGRRPARRDDHGRRFRPDHGAVVRDRHPRASPRRTRASRPRWSTPPSRSVGRSAWRCSRRCSPTRSAATPATPGTPVALAQAEAAVHGYTTAFWWGGHPVRRRDRDPAHAGQATAAQQAAARRARPRALSQRTCGAAARAARSRVPSCSERASRRRMERSNEQGRTASATTVTVPNPSTAAPRRGGWTAGRIVGAAGGSILALIGVLLVLGGAAVIAVHGSERDSDALRPRGPAPSRPTEPPS